MTKEKKVRKSDAYTYNIDQWLREMHAYSRQCSNTRSRQWRIFGVSIIDMLYDHRLTRLCIYPQNAASVRADQPIPSQAGVYYFEVEVVSRGQKGYIGIGFSTRSVELARMPGERRICYVKYRETLPTKGLCVTKKVGMPNHMDTTATTARHSHPVARDSHMALNLGAGMS